jgi:hypothetical protein
MTGLLGLSRVTRSPPDSRYREGVRSAFVIGSFGLLGWLAACGSFGASDDGPATSTPDPGPDAAATETSAPGPDGAPVQATTDRYGLEVLADHPLAYFRFEETAGVLPKNEIAGSPVTAILSTGVAVGAQGISAGRLGIRMGSATSQLDVIGTMTFANEDAFSVEAWAELTTDADAGGSGRVFLNMDNPNAESRRGQWLFLNADGSLRVETWNGSGLVYYAQTPPAPLPKLTWLHIVFLHSSAEKLDLLYVNGTKSTDAARLLPSLRVAPAAPLSWTGFVGRFDELAIYPSALSPARIVAHYAAR